MLSRVSLRDVVTLTAVACLLLGLATIALRTARDSARRTHCAINLLQIGMGLRSYHDTWRRFPPAFLTNEKRQPVHSWRVLSLPYWTSDSFYDGYDLRDPWNATANMALTRKSGLHYYFECPANRSPESMTNYLAIVGATTAWPFQSCSDVQHFSRGPSHTILLVEQADSGIYWTEPRDLEFDQLVFTVPGGVVKRSSNGQSDSPRTICSCHRKGAHVLFADASVEFLADDIPSDVLSDMLIIQGNDPQKRLGRRKRLRYVFDADLPEPGVKNFPYRLESYTVDDMSQPN